MWFGLHNPNKWWFWKK